MKVLNIHTRIIQQPRSEIGKLLDTLASDDDRMLATHKWPRMRLDKGLQIGSKGGHAMIKYWVADYQPGHSIRFQFTMAGFQGFHEFRLNGLGTQKTELRHVIEMQTTGLATLKWALAIRWLHDAFIEDAFDRVENQFIASPRTMEWNLWVRFLRWTFGRRKRQHQTAR